MLERLDFQLPGVLLQEDVQLQELPQGPHVCVPLQFGFVCIPVKIHDVEYSYFFNVLQ